MGLAIGLLIAPTMLHRIADDGRDTRRIHRATGLLAGLSLLPFEISLGIGFFVVFESAFGVATAWAGGTILCALAGLLWYALGFAIKAKLGEKPMNEPERATPLATRIDQMLTEARVILPGAQALIGFQFTVMLTQAFAQLPFAIKLVHAGGLCCVAVAVILLMTPAALHRIAFDGRDAPEFFRMGSWFVVAAPAPLAFGIAADLCVAIGHAAGSYAAGAAAAGAMLLMLAALWYALPLSIRQRPAPSAQKVWRA